MNVPNPPAPTRSPTPRQQGLLNAKRLLSSGLGRSAAVAQWEHAVRHLRAAELAGMEPSIGVKLAYDGALAGCLAVLATYDLEPAGSQGYHEAAFAGVEYTDDPAFANLIADSSAIRSGRTKTLYDADVATEDQHAKALEFARAFLTSVRANLLAWDPSLASFAGLNSSLHQ